MARKRKGTAFRQVPGTARPVSKQHNDGLWQLLYEDKALVQIGDSVLSHSGECYVVTGGAPPHKPASSGFIWVESFDLDHIGSEYYPSVFNCKWTFTPN